MEEQGLEPYNLKWTDRELACAYIYLRLFRRKEVLRSEEWKAAKKLFITQYIKFYVTTNAHKRKEKRMVEQKRELIVLMKRMTNKWWKIKVILKKEPILLW